MMKGHPRRIYLFVDSSGNPHVSEDWHVFASMNNAILFAVYDRVAVGNIKTEPSITLLHDNVKPEETWM